MERVSGSAQCLRASRKGQQTEREKGLGSKGRMRKRGAFPRNEYAGTEGMDEGRTGFPRRTVG